MPPAKSATGFLKTRQETEAAGLEGVDIGSGTAHPTQTGHQLWEWRHHKTFMTADPLSR
jgi:hypothetical protein